MSNGIFFDGPPPHPPGRRVISVSVTGVGNNSATQCNYVRLALCDDGSMWESDDTHPEWQPVRPIPQEPLP